MKKKFLLALAAALVAGATPALAHPGHGEAVGLIHGFVHPMSGIDHIVAMVAVGLFAAQLGGRALWLVPTSFVAMMGVGGMLGISSVDVPFVEVGIAMSVVVLGFAIAFAVRPPVALAMGLVGAFAIFHGHAHGAEMPVGASGLNYAIGFMLATALLHVAGIGLGFGVGRFAANRSLRIVQTGGGIMALAGVGLLAGWL